jgi:hypothetical protein
MSTSTTDIHTNLSKCGSLQFSTCCAAIREYRAQILGVDHFRSRVIAIAFPPSPPGPILRPESRQGCIQYISFTNQKVLQYSGVQRQAASYVRDVMGRAIMPNLEYKLQPSDTQLVLRRNQTIVKFDLLLQTLYPLQWVCYSVSVRRSYEP